MSWDWGESSKGRGLSGFPTLGAPPSSALHGPTMVCPKIKRKGTKISNRKKRLTQGAEVGPKLQPQGSLLP